MPKRAAQPPFLRAVSRRSSSMGWRCRRLFTSEKTGQALTERGLGYMIKKYARAANLAHLRPHDLRHRFGYRMAQVVPLHRLAEIMGHDSLDTTMIYIKSTKADLQQAVEKIAWV